MRGSLSLLLALLVSPSAAFGQAQASLFQSRFHKNLVPAHSVFISMTKR